MPRSVTALVGRTAELEAALRSVRSADTGTASVLVLDGDAGVGKTRLVAEFAAAAAAEHVLVVVGNCIDLGDSPPPYLPFTSAFKRLAVDHPELVSELLAAHPALARLIPGEGAPSRHGEERVDRAELFEAVFGALAALAARRCVLLILEDVHWADQATRDLLGFLFTRLSTQRLALVVTYRSDDLHRRHPLRPALAEWSRLPAVTRLHLAPLPPAEVRELVTAVHDLPLSEFQLRSIVDRADGNAFFAEELAAAVEQYDSTQLPWQLADVMLVRLDRLSPDAREVVRVAAVAGRMVTHELLAATIALPPGALEPALRDAVDTHVLEPSPSGRGYVFRHALLAEAVYDDLLPGERVRIHAAYAAAIADRSPGRAAELARHARASHDLATAFEASVRAGDEALALAAPQEALQQYEAALELAPQTPAAPTDLSPLVLSLVEAAVAAGRPDRGEKLARAALSALDDAAPAEARARLLFAFASAVTAAEIDDEPLALTAEALRLTPEQPPTAFRARLAALHARIAYIIGREVEAQRWALASIDLARLAGCAEAVADGQSTLALLKRRSADPEEAAKGLAEAAVQAYEAGDGSTEVRSRYGLGTLLYEIGDLDRALTAYEQTYARAVELGRPWELFGMHSRAMIGLIQYVRGDWAASLETLDTSAEAPPDLAAAMLAATGLRVRAGRGEAEQVLATFAQLRPWWPREGRVWLYSLLPVLEVHEQQARAEEALTLIADAVRELGVLWQDEWFLARIELAARGVAVLTAAVNRAPQAARAGLVDAAAQLVADGRTSAEKGLPSGRRLGIEGRAWVERLEAEWARLRWTAGIDAPAESEHIAVWQRTVEAFGYGDVVQQSTARTRLAAVLRAAGRGPDAATQADLARQAAKDMGAVPLLAEIRALGLTAAPRAGAGNDALTARERDVLALLVEGHTNRQIAAQLYISEKTVSVHVSNILAKLGARGRSEAAAIARRDGLLA